VAATPPFRVLVAGSRAFADYPLLCATLDRLLAGRGPVVVVSGGAGGADRLGERYAADRGLPVERYVPDWGAHGRAAGPIRNREMVAKCALAVFFWDGASPGTADAIARARKAGVPVEVVRYADPTPPPSPTPAVVAPQAPPAGGPPPRKLLDRVRDALRVRHYAIRTEDAYADWVKRFVLFHGKRHPDDMGEPEVNAYLTHLAVEGGVAASTQNQALCALLFLYVHVLGRPLDQLRVVRAARPDRLPVLLSQNEVRVVLDRMPVHRVVADERHRAGRDEVDEEEAGERATEPDPGPRGAGENPAVVGRVAGGEVAEGAEDVGDGPPAGGEHRPDQQCGEPLVRRAGEVEGEGLNQRVCFGW